MPNTKKLLLVFIPAILLVGFAFFLRLIQHAFIFAQPEEPSNETEALASIPIFPEDPIVGSKKAPTTLIVFGDWACEACRQLDEVTTRLIQKHPKKIKLIWKGLPVATFPVPSRWAHRYAYCAHQQQKFSSFKTLAFANQNNLTVETLDALAQEIPLDAEELQECLNSPELSTYLTNNENLARLLNIQAVPTVFLDNQQIKAPLTLTEWEGLLQL